MVTYLDGVMNRFCVFESHDANKLFLKLALHPLEQGNVENHPQDAIRSHNKTSRTLVGRLLRNIDSERTGTSFPPGLVLSHGVKLRADAVDAFFVLFARFGCCKRNVGRVSYRA